MTAINQPFAKHPHCRIGTVTLKSSGLQIVRLSSGSERTRRSIMSETSEMFDSMAAYGNHVVGFAMVMWSADGSSDAACRAYPGSNIPTIAVPDFVRNRLLASKIIEWGKG